MALAAIAPLAGAALGFIGGQMTNRQSEDNAWLQMNFQRDMASTQYQRAVADLRAAGLNPMLSMIHGGAAAPQGAQPNHLENPGIASSQAMIATLQAQNLREQNEKLQAETRNVDADTDIKRWTIPQINAQTLATGSQHHLNIARQDEAQANIAQLMSRAGLNQDEMMLVREEVKNAAEQNRQIRANTDNTKVNTLLHQLQVRMERNKEAAAGTWFGRNVMPYTGSAAEIGRAGAGAGIGIRGLRIR